MSNKGGNKRSLSVVLYDNETLDHALRRFKRKIKQDSMIKTLKRKEYFISKSEIKREKRRRKKYSDGRNFNEEIKKEDFND